MRPNVPSVRPKPGWQPALCLLLTATGLTLGCGDPAADGDCGPALTGAECNVVRTQIGRLALRPPPDVTNRFGRCENENSSECLLEADAVKLGHRLFYDRCLSVDKGTACVTCHDPKSAYIDSRVRPVLSTPSKILVDGVERTLPLPLLKGARTWERIHTPPPVVEPELDENGTPLAEWNGNEWVGAMRRPQTSYGATPTGTAQLATPRHSPTLYNVGFGAAVPHMEPSGSPTRGAVWVPWDGRYDSSWALTADVWEFGVTHGTDRAHIALRVFLKHRSEYEAMMRRALPDLEQKDPATGKYVYPRHGSPGLAKGCWYGAMTCDDMVSLVPAPAVRDEINQVFVNAGKAVGAYMRQLRSGDSAFDRFMSGDWNAMSAAQQRGLKLFIGKAECVMCHNGPNFTDWQFHNIGVPVSDSERRAAGSSIVDQSEAVASCFEGTGPSPGCPDAGRFGWQQRALGMCERDTGSVAGRALACQRVDVPDSLKRFDVAMDCRGPASDAADKASQCIGAAVYPLSKCQLADETTCTADSLCRWQAEIKDSMGRVLTTPRCVAKVLDSEKSQFKTPSLRNIALTFPYMHNGALFDYGPSFRGETSSMDPTPHLRKVVEFYNTGGLRPLFGSLDPEIHALHLSPAEVSDLVEFLKALTDNSFGDKSPGGLATMPNDLLDVADCPQ